MSTGNRTELDPRYIQSLFVQKTQVFVEGKAGVGEQHVSLLKNLQFPGPEEDVVGLKIMEKFKYEKISKKCPTADDRVTLSLQHPGQGNPIVREFLVVNDPRIDIQLSADALLHVSALWIEDAWLPRLHCIFKGKITSRCVRYLLTVLEAFILDRVVSSPVRESSSVVAAEADHSSISLGLVEPLCRSTVCARHPMESILTRFRDSVCRRV